MGFTVLFSLLMYVGTLHNKKKTVKRKNHANNKICKFSISFRHQEEFTLSNTQMKSTPGQRWEKSVRVPSALDARSQWNRKHQGCFASPISALPFCVDSTDSRTTLCNKTVLLRAVTNLQIQNPVRQPFLTAHQFPSSSSFFLSKQDSKIHHYIHNLVNTLKSCSHLCSLQPWMNSTSCLLCICTQRMTR